MADLEPHEIRHLLSVPASTDPGQVSRRRFLQGALAAGTIAAAPGWWDHLAAAASPLAADEGVLVVLHLGGGNDGLNTVVPVGSSTYRSLRGNLAITDPLPLTSSYGLHPSLPKLRTRFVDGKVAIVHGVGQTSTTDMSHFSSTASWMAGTSGTGRTTGWLGRWLDDVPEAAAGLRAVAIGASVPLHLVGRRSVVTALDTSGDLPGADRTDPWNAAMYDAIAGFGSGPTGKGAWADRVAGAGRASVEQARRLSPMFAPKLADAGLAAQLTLVARLINADLGIRVFDVALSGFDTHRGQPWRHGELLAELEGAIDGFYKTLAATWSRRVALMTFSEFGRSPRANASQGTDHGTASTMLVIGDNVRAGFHATAPSLTALTSAGDLVPSVDYRAAYASVIEGWLGGDASGVLGQRYTGLDLFRTKPGSVSTPPATIGAWVPFATPSALVRQQYLDFLSRVGDAGGVQYWTSKLTSGQRSVSSVIESFLDSNEFGRAIAPVARVALAALGGPPAFDDLMDWTAQAKAGTPLAAVADAVCTRKAFAEHYAPMSAGVFVPVIFRDVLGRAPTYSETTDLVPRLHADQLSRGALIADLTNRPEAVRRSRAQVEVLMTYAGLLRRAPDPSGWAYWVRKGESGTSIQRLIAQFFTSAEYRRRFGGS